MSLSEGVHERRAVLCVLVAAVLAYLPCLAGDFVFDDLHAVRDNSALTSLANIPSFFVDVDTFSSLDCRLYRPVLLTTYALDASVGGMHPWAFKLTNLLLHAACSVLIYSIARRFAVARISAAVAAVLFAVHPMASEAVNTISGRSNLLMVAGLLAAVRCHFAAMSGRLRWSGGTLLCGIVAVGSKEPGLILPVLLCVMEGLRTVRTGDRDLRGAFLRVAPTAVLMVGFLAVRDQLLGSATAGMGQWQGTDVNSGHGRGMETQLATMALLLPTTLLRTIWPVGLTMDPIVPYASSFASPLSLAGGGGLVLLTILGLRAPRRRPALFLGTCLAWGAALPWVIKPLNLPYLEHRLYGVLAGLALVVAAWVPERLSWAWPQRLAVGGIVLTFGLMAAGRSLEFTSSEKLWSTELARNPESRLAMAGLAVHCMEQGEYARAMPLLRVLVRTYPDRRDARVNLAEAALKTGDLTTAGTQTEYLVRKWPRNPFHLLLRSRALAAEGVVSKAAEQFDDAARHFDAAVDAALSCLDIAEPKGLVFQTAARARQLQGDLDAAIDLLTLSVEEGLNHSSVLFDRSDLYLAKGMVDRARIDLSDILRREPFNLRAFEALRVLQSGTQARPRVIR